MRRKDTVSSGSTSTCSLELLRKNGRGHERAAVRTAGPIRIEMWISKFPLKMSALYEALEAAESVSAGLASFHLALPFTGIDLWGGGGKEGEVQRK